MEREERYIVIKKSDIKYALYHGSLIGSDIDTLNCTLEVLNLERHRRGKADLKTVVVEHDWPEYERVWKMIEARVDGHVEEDIMTLRRKAELFDMIRNLMGYVENGTDTSVTLFQDDATRSFTVAIGRSHERKGESSPSLEESIRRMFRKYGDKE